MLDLFFHTIINNYVFRDHKICRTKDTLNSKNTVECDEDDIFITIEQKLWPDHCVMNTVDSNFSSELEISPSDIIIRKVCIITIFYLNNVVLYMYLGKQLLY